MKLLFRLQPDVVHAIVFECRDALWFNNAVEETHSERTRRPMPGQVFKSMFLLFAVLIWLTLISWQGSKLSPLSLRVVVEVGFSAEAWQPSFSPFFVFPFSSLILLDVPNIWIPGRLQGCQLEQPPRCDACISVSPRVQQARKRAASLYVRASVTPSRAVAYNDT